VQGGLAVSCYPVENLFIGFDGSAGGDLAVVVRVECLLCEDRARAANGLDPLAAVLIGRDVVEAKLNVTDPDSGRLKTRSDFVQGYNAQAVVTEQQIVLAAEITNSTVDWSQLDPMVTATLAELARAGSAGRLEVALADTQYWNEQHMDEVMSTCKC